MGKRPFLNICVALGFVFLYAPILALVILSFNESKLVTVWGGFSFKWYGVLFHSKEIINAAILSFEIAALTASIAVVFGTLIAIVLVRYRKFRGRMLFSLMATAPLVMPEVITGLSLLLLFVGMESVIGWPAGRGMVTLTIAHATLTMAYAAVIIQSRLTEMDHSIEEAAMDLGARPARVYFSVTLPILAPALVAAWLLAFTLSLDTLVLSSFVSGPGYSTLPMIIFSKVKLGVSPEVNALATIVITIVSLGILTATITLRRQERKRIADEQQSLATNE